MNSQIGNKGDVGGIKYLLDSGILDIGAFNALSGGEILGITCVFAIIGVVFATFRTRGGAAW